MTSLRSQFSGPHYALVEQIADTVYSAQCLDSEAYYNLGFPTGLAIEQEAQGL